MGTGAAAEEPDEEFYRYILKSEGFKASDSFFTDDSLVNLESAARVGMTTFRYTQDNRALEEFFRPYVTAGGEHGRE